MAAPMWAQDSSGLFYIAEQDLHSTGSQTEDTFEQRLRLDGRDRGTRSVIVTEVHINRPIGRRWSSILFGPHLGCFNTFKTRHFLRERDLIPGVAFFESDGIDRVVVNDT